ncbi:MAG: DUF6011 domain-containing protein [Sandaracinus sp.]
MVVDETVDRVRVVFPGGAVRTFLLRSTNEWDTISEGTSDSFADRSSRMLARLMRAGEATCERCGRALRDQVSRALGTGPECRRKLSEPERARIDRARRQWSADAAASNLADIKFEDYPISASWQDEFLAAWVAARLWRHP